MPSTLMEMFDLNNNHFLGGSGQIVNNKKRVGHINLVILKVHLLHL